MIWLSNSIEFPPHDLATPDGILALGGDLSTERLIHAYKNGIFPWYSEEDPIVWYSPWERMVLFPKELKISKSMKQVIKKQDFEISENKAFEEIINHCKTISRKDEMGTWITDEMKEAYIQLHQISYAKSIEVWKEGELVGGLYGVDIGNGVFCGESMFSKMSNASKLAFIHLVKYGGYKLIDCQVYNDHLASLGAREIPRAEFLSYL